MARNITSTTPAGFAGSDLVRDPNAVIADIRDNGFDAGRVDAIRGDYMAARDAAIIARDVDAAIEIIAVIDALSDANAVAFDADRHAAAVYMAFAVTAAAHEAALTPRAAAMVARDAARMVAADPKVMARIGGIDATAYAPSADGGTFGATGTPTRPVGPAVDAFFDAHPNAVATHTEIAKWVTANGIGGYSRAAALSVGAVNYYASKIGATGANARHAAAAGIRVADWSVNQAASLTRD